MEEKQTKKVAKVAKEAKATKEEVKVEASKETKEVKVNNEKKQPIVSKDKLLEAGTYFGHRASMWNPKMKDFLYNQPKRGIYIINTNITQQRLEFAYNLLSKFIAKNPRATVLFLGTKKQARETIKDNALRTNSYFVTERWIGGTFTNYSTVFSRIKTMEQLEKMAAKNYEGYTKKEGLLFQKKLDKLHKNFEGTRTMNGLPTFMIVVDPNKDAQAIREARAKGVKIIGILDSNSDPDLVDFGIPANDDSAKSIALIITILADAIAVARGGKAKFAYQPDDKIVLPENKNENHEGNRHFNNRQHFNGPRKTFVRTPRNNDQAQSQEVKVETKGE